MRRRSLFAAVAGAIGSLFVAKEAESKESIFYNTGENPYTIHLYDSGDPYIVLCVQEDCTITLYTKEAAIVNHYSNYDTYHTMVQHHRVNPRTEIMVIGRTKREAKNTLMYRIYNGKVYT